jgi:hypothetical protein
MSKALGASIFMFKVRDFLFLGSSRNFDLHSSKAVLFAMIALNGTM